MRKAKTKRKAIDADSLVRRSHAAFAALSGRSARKIPVSKVYKKSVNQGEPKA